MADGIHLANAYVSLSTSTRGLRKEIDKSLGGSYGAQQGRGIGSRMAAGMGRMLKAGAAAAAVTAGVAAGAALTGGFRSAIAQENTEKTLKGLYGSASSATDMMGRLRDIATGSPIEHSAYSAGAEALAYLGLEGKQAAGILENIGAAVITAGGGSEEMGRATDALTKMQNAGKVQLDTLNQLSEAGVPIFSGLAEHFGTSIGNVRDMVTEGKVGMEDVLAVTENATGDTFQSMKKASNEASKSFGNQWKIAKDNVVVAIGERLRPAIERMTPLISRAGAAIAGFVTNFGTGGGGAIGRFTGMLSRLGSVVASGLGSALQWIAPHVRTFASSMAGLAPQAKELASAVGSFLMAAFRAARPYLEAAARVLGVVLVAALKALPPILSVVMSNLRMALGVLRPMLPLVAGLAAAFVVYRGVMFAAGLATKAWVVITKAAAIAQRVFNAAMRMNPIGLVITALIALGAGMVLAYKKSETFRRIVNAAWAGIKAAAAATVAWFRNTAWPWLKGAFTNIGNAAKWLWRNAIQPAFRGIGAVISWWYNNIVKRYFALVRGAFRVVASVARWLWRKALVPAFQGIAKVIRWWWSGVRRYFALVGAIFRVAARVGRWLWRKALVPAFRGIVAVAKWLWARLRNYFNLIGRIWRVAVSVARWLWQKGIRPAFQGIARLGSWLWGRLKASFNFIRGGFRGVQRIARWLWDKGIRPTFNWIADKAKWLWGRAKWAFDRMKAGMTALRDRFATVRDQIGRIWDRLKGKITGPVKSAIKWLQRNFVGKLNSWMGKIPGVPKKGILGKIPMPSGWASGGYTGRGSKYDPAGIVHRDEFVVQKSSRRKFERENPGALDHLNRTGTLPGYRIGGKVAGLNKRFLDMLHAFNAAAGGRYRVNSGYRSNAHQRVLYNRYLAGRGPVAARPGSSQHNKGLAADLAPSNARDVHGGLARSMGLVFTVPSESWHIEPSWGRGSNAGPSSGGGGGGFGLPGWVSSPIKYVKDKIKGLTDKFDPSKFGIVGKTIPAVFNKIKDAVTTKVKEAAASFAPDFLGGGGGGNISFAGIQGGTNKILGKAMAERYGWTGAQWSALKVLWEKESNWNHRARNPSSGAHGIPQSLPASKMRSEGADYLTNPRTQIAWGLKYIRQRYGNPGRALSFHHRNNWYADGGLVRPAVFDNGGTLAPGVNVVHNKTGKPEPLIRPEAALSGPVTVNVVDRDGTLLDRIRGEIDMADRHAATRTRMGAGRRY